jgi:hypothetical protein
MNKLRVYRNMMVHDSVCVQKGSVPPGQVQRFFCDLRNKNMVDTTFSNSRRLTTGTWLHVKEVVVRLPATVGDVAVSELDKAKVLDEGFLRIMVNNMRLVQGPLWAFMGELRGASKPWYRRLWHWLTRKPQPTVFRLGKLPVLETLTSSHDLWAELTFCSRTWLMGCGVNHRLTLDGPVMVQVCLMGIATEEE